MALSGILDKIIEGFSKGFSMFEDKAADMASKAERNIEAKLSSFRKSIQRAAVELFLILISVGFITAGIILFLSEIFELYLVLLSAGIIILYVLLILRLLNKKII